MFLEVVFYVLLVFLEVTNGFGIEFVFVVYRRFESVAGDKIEEFILNGDSLNFELKAAFGEIWDDILVVLVYLALFLYLFYDKGADYFRLK